VKQINFPQSFLTGHAVIDEHHRRHIALINHINICFQDKLGAEAKQTCTALQNFMDEHLEREEKILQDNEFPRLEEHIVDHGRLVEKCRAVLSHCNNVCLINKAEVCTTKLFIAIVEHIVGSDLDLKSFLQAQGVAEPAE
jgi:hemerythrin